jgi:chromosome partitioning protein
MGHVSRETKRVAIANQKGGVGKTTTAVNLSACLHSLGRRVLLCDFDPQGNATSALGVRGEPGRTVYDMIVGGRDAVAFIVHTHFCDLLPSDTRLAAAEQEIAGREGRALLLRRALEALEGQYDYIFIDCPPSLGLLSINGMAAGDTVLIPMQCEYFALEGLSQIVASIRSIKNGINPALDVEGILLTMYDGRTNLTIQVSEEIKKHFGGKVYKTAIPRNVRLSEAPSHGLPVIAYDRVSRGAAAYMAVAHEFIKGNEG